MDVDGHPWGIPAGHVEPFEKTPYQTAEREVMEETGLVINPDKLKLFALNESFTEPEPRTVKPIYLFQASWTEVKNLGEWIGIPPENKLFHEILMLRRPLSDVPGEIGNLALVDLQDFNHRTQRPRAVSPSYRFDYTWDTIRALAESY